MRRTAVLGLIWLLAAGIAWAQVPSPALDDDDRAASGKTDEEALVETPACEAAQPLSADELAAWAVENGFEVETRVASSPPSCPPIISCNATHCIETPTCTITDFGSSSCSGHVTLNCPLGTTIKIRRCRCAGGGCQVRNSQTFFCL